MSVAPIAVSDQAAESRTWRQFRRALLVVALAVGVGGLLYGVETGLLGCEHRCVENPVDAMMRSFGLAHFAVGWLFLFTSPGLRRPGSLLHLLGWSAAGVALCLVYQAGGATKSPLVLMAFYGVFLVHEVRDEADLFRRYGDAPDAPGSERFLSALSLAVSLLLMTLLAGVHLVHGLWRRQTPILLDADAGPLLVGWTGLLIATILVGQRAFRLGRELHGGLGEIAVLYAPLLRVYAAILAILLLGSLLGSVGLNLIILLHVAAWLVFVHHQLGRSPPPTADAWAWLRRTPAGFLTLHLGAVILILVLFALRVHAWERSGWVCDALAKSSFPYWSLMHIAMAFARPR
jgi:hypothetical protein